MDNLKLFIALFKRETLSYFKSPLAYSLWVFFSLYNGYFLSVLTYYLQSILAVGFWISNAAMISLFIIPLITMRLISDDRHNGTDRLLLQMPIHPGLIITAKYAAACTVFTVLTALNVPVIALLKLWMHADTLPLVANIVGLLCFGYTLTSIGVFSATITKHSLTAALTAIGITLMFWMMSGLSTLVPDSVQSTVKLFSLYDQLSVFSTGMIPLHTLLYIVLINLFFLGSSYAIFMGKALRFSFRKVLISVAIGLACLLLCIGGIGQQPFQIDVSGQAVSRLASQSEKRIAAITSPLHIRVVPDRNVETLRYLKPLLNAYAKANSLVSYTWETPSDNGSVTFIYQNQTITVPTHRFTLLLDNPSQELFLGEPLINGVLLRLTSPPKHILFTLGHGEKSLADTDTNGLSWLARTLEDEGYSIRQTPLSAMEKGTQIVISALPKQPFSETELQQLEAFIKQGGIFIFLTDPFATNPLETWLKQWGIHSYKHGIIDSEAHQFYGQDELMVSSKVGPLVLPGSTYFTVSTPHKTLLQSSDLAWATASFTPPSPLKQGSFTLAAEVSVNQGTVMVIGDSDFIGNGALFTESNRQFILQTLAGYAQIDSAAPPRIKALEHLRLSRLQWGYLALLGLVVIPGIGLLLGIIFFLKQK